MVIYFQKPWCQRKSNEIHVLKELRLRFFFRKRTVYSSLVYQVDSGKTFQTFTILTQYNYLVNHCYQRFLQEALTSTCSVYLRFLISFMTLNRSNPNLSNGLFTLHIFASQSISKPLTCRPKSATDPQTCRCF